MADITMPQLGETVTEGTITKWHKQVGDAVAEDEVLFEVSTDKVDSEVPSPVAGVVTEILVTEGDTVDVGTKLAVVSDSGAAPAPAAAPAQAPAEPVVEAASPAPAPPPAPEVVQPAAPPVGAMAENQGAGEASKVSADGGRSARGGSGARPSGSRPTDGRPPSGPDAGAGKVLSPVVRRLISDNGLDASQIAGTGAGGRITRDDVLAVLDQRGSNGSARTSAPASAPSAAPAVESYAPAVAAAPVPRAEGNDSVVPFTNIRRRTAEHMIRSKHTSAHTMVATEVDYSAVDKVRLANKDRFKATEGFSLTYLPFIARAVVDALAEWPYLNASVGEDELIVHHDVNLGFAVDLDFEGLLVPVVHQAETKRLVAIARDVSTLASRARSKRVTMDDISGGTFTITNAGGFGTFLTVPVINQPQVAILSTDGVRKRPVVVTAPDGTESIGIHPVGNLVLSWDHRAVDGAYAAAFMAAVREIIETRDWSVEL